MKEGIVDIDTMTEIAPEGSQRKKLMSLKHKLLMEALLSLKVLYTIKTVKRK